MPLDPIAIALTATDASIDTSTLAVYRLVARERMSTTYRVELHIVAAGNDPTLEDLEGARLRAVLDRGGGTLRTFSGVVAEATERFEHDGTRHLRLVLRPQLFFASLVEKYDIRIREAVDEMLARKLSDIGLATADVLLHLTPNGYQQRDLMLQYAETDLAFIARWCEHFGIYHYFATGDGGDELLVLGDDVSGYRPIGAIDEVPFVSAGEQVGIYALEATRRLIPTLYVCRDYDYEKPDDELHADLELPTGEGFGGLVFEFGTHFKTAAEGQMFAARRADIRKAQRTVLKGESAEPRLAPGHTFNLTQHPRHDGQWVVTACEHVATQVVSGFGGEGNAYANTFEAIQASLCYRPPRETPWPRVHGVISAIVETGQGQRTRDAILDDQGRYRIRFLFDHEVELRSCMVRMMQPSAGNGYGIHFPLKPGTEVAVVFLDGNPDRPVIAGALPNPHTASPVGSTDATKNRIKSRSGILLELDDATRGS